MQDPEQYEDEYEYYERMFDPVQTDRRARRKRKPVARHVPKRDEEVVIAELGDLVGLEGGFRPTYTPGRYEEGWLLESIRSFYDQGLIVDVLSLVKGGKEASVYLCQAHPSTGADLLAAKVYRPRRFRNLSNDKVYRQGRDVLTADGRAVKKTDHRVMRAIGKKTAFGMQVSHTSWLMHEYNALRSLYSAGGAVPRPYAATENAILMGYCGDARLAAPTLSHIRLDEDEAEPLYQEAMRNVELMLSHGMIHGDLSAYNILYWEGAIMLIDFPQVVSLDANREALDLLDRDVTRVCAYFGRQGAAHEPGPIVERLWEIYGMPLPPVDLELMTLDELPATE
ncbi:MAG: RIO1 family regulatory kinase/ATPase [Anaerolineae bacterium]|jgi:RIO kinase 1